MAQYGVQRADPQRPVVRNREAVTLRRLRLEDDVTTDLVDLPIRTTGRIRFGPSPGRIIRAAISREDFIAH